MSRASAASSATLASELRITIGRLRRRLVTERPDGAPSLSAIGVLGVLERHGSMTIGELANHELVRPPTMTRIVTSLERDRLVTRRPRPDDGRIVVVELTAPGRETVRADRAARDAWLARRLQSLTQDQRDALRMAAPILEQLARR